MQEVIKHSSHFSLNVFAHGVWCNAQVFFTLSTFCSVSEVLKDAPITMNYDQMQKIPPTTFPL